MKTKFCLAEPTLGSGLAHALAVLILKAKCSSHMLMYISDILVYIMILYVFIGMVGQIREIFLRQWDSERRLHFICHIWIDGHIAKMLMCKPLLVEGKNVWFY